MYASAIIVLLVVLYILYQYFLAPIPGDTTSVDSVVFRKSVPQDTQYETVVAKDVLMTKTGALSFLFTMESIDAYKNDAPIMIPILTMYKSDKIINLQVLFNRLTSEIVIGFYNSNGDMFTVPVSTGALKQKVSIVIRLMNTSNNNTFLANVYLNGEYITSRGIPFTYAPIGDDKHTITTGCSKGVKGKIQTIRVWENASELSDDDIMKVSSDPFDI